MKLLNGRKGPSLASGFRCKFRWNFSQIHKVIAEFKECNSNRYDWPWTLFESIVNYFDCARQERHHIQCLTSILLIFHIVLPRIIPDPRNFLVISLIKFSIAESMARILAVFKTLPRSMVEFPLTRVNKKFQMEVIQ